MKNNLNQKKFDEAEKRDFDFFLPRFKSICKHCDINVLSVSRTQPGCTWDATAVLEKGGVVYNYVIELKDRGSYGYTLEDIKKKGTIFIDYNKTQTFGQYSKMKGVKGLYVFLFPNENKLMMSDWREAWCHSTTRERYVNGNTINNTGAVCKKVYELELADKCLLKYAFNDDATVKCLCTYKPQEN